MRFLALAFVLAACNCATPNLRMTEKEVQGMMASVVQIQVQIAVTAIPPEGEEVEMPLVSWTGSGVAYESTGGVFSPTHTRILTANHVLEAPKVGDTQTEDGILFRVDAVFMTIKTDDNRTCELQPLMLGVDDFRDVAVGEAYCEVPLAHLAGRLPPVGGKLYVMGHPLGVGNTMVTEGFYSGFMDNYMVASAPIAPGNSGGPVFYNGQVVGLAVRGSNRYDSLSVIAPLEQILLRVQQLN